jgi:hypothetical protein
MKNDRRWTIASLRRWMKLLLNPSSLVPRLSSLVIPLLLLLPTLAHASQATLVSWDTPTTCIVSCASYTAPDCPISQPTETSVGCGAITGYKIHAGTSSGVYTISTTVLVSNSAPLATISGSLPRGYICVVATTLTASAESDYSNERCYWNMGNAVFSNNATRPVPKKPGNAGSGTYATDNFNRANVNPIAGNWTTNPGAGAMRISGNQLMGVGTSNTIYWNANSFSNNQCSRVTMVDLGATYGGPAVRVSSSQHSYYYFKVANGGTAYEYGKVVNGSWSPLGAAVSGTPQANDVLTFCAFDNVLTGYVNGVFNATRTDSSLNSGGPGVTLYGTVTHLKDWAGWDGSLLPFAPNQYVQAEAGTLSGMAIGVSAPIPLSIRPPTTPDLPASRSPSLLPEITKCRRGSILIIPAGKTHFTLGLMGRPPKATMSMNITCRWSGPSPGTRLIKWEVDLIP